MGTESPTFIKPVQKRKDSIEAMFMRQSKAPKKRACPSLSLLCRRLSSSIHEEGQGDTRALPGGNDGRVLTGCRHVAVRETRQS